MRKPFFHLAAAALIGLAMTMGAAKAQSVMKVCGEQWKAAKAAGTTNGETWPQFLAQCRAQQKGSAATAAPTVAPAPAAPAPTYGQAPPSGAVKTTSQCDAEYAAKQGRNQSVRANQARVRRRLPRWQPNDSAGNRRCPATNVQSAGCSSSSARPSAVYRFTFPLVATRCSSRSPRVGSSPNDV